MAAGQAVPAMRGGAAWQGCRPAPLPACRCCSAPLAETVADLGLAPLGGPRAGPGTETFHPLHVLVCSDCRLVQLAGGEELPAPEGEAPSGPSFPLAGQRDGEAFARRFAAWLDLGPDTPVVEVAGGEGMLLQHFQRVGIPVLGIAPAGAAARAAMAPGVPADIAAFGAAAARRLRASAPAPAAILGRGLLASARDPHDVLEGVRILLAPGGVASLEFPHLLPLMRDTALDRFHLGQTFYLSLLVAELLAWQHGLTVFDAEALPAGGGALRLFLRHVEDTARPVTPEVQRIRAEERAAGLEGAEAYARFARFVVEAKCALLDFLVGLRRAGRRVAGYGVPARGSALLSYCGIGPELLPFVVDPDAGLEGCTLPGARIPVLGPEAVLQERPDYLLLLSAHRREEAEARLPAIRGWGGRLALPGPTLRVV